MDMGRRNGRVDERREREETGEETEGKERNGEDWIMRVKEGKVKESLSA